MRTTYCLLLCVVCLFAFLWIADGLRPEENAAKNLQEVRSVGATLDYCSTPAVKNQHSPLLPHSGLRLLRLLITAVVSLVPFRGRGRLSFSRLPALYRNCPICPIADNRGGHAPPLPLAAF